MWQKVTSFTHLHSGFLTYPYKKGYPSCLFHPYIVKTNQQVTSCSEKLKQLAKGFSYGAPPRSPLGHWTTKASFSTTSVISQGVAGKGNKPHTHLWGYLQQLLLLRLISVIWLALSHLISTKKSFVSISSPILSVGKHHFTNTDHFTDYWSFISIRSPFCQRNWKMILNNLPY